MIPTGSCSECKHWDCENVRNCGTTVFPVYYAACRYPLIDTRLPLCVETVEMCGECGHGCECFEPKAK